MSAAETNCIYSLANRRLRPYDQANSAASIDRAGVRPLFLCTQFMNAIAAHKDQLEKLLENLSGEIVVSKITFVALLDAYITRLDANYPEISAGVTPLPAQIKGQLTWNQH
jgi:hypothetical protein